MNTKYKKFLILPTLLTLSLSFALTAYANHDSNNPLNADAQFVSQSINGTALTGSNPTYSMVAGQTYTAAVTMKNIGASSWTNNSSYSYFLGSQNPQDNQTWGPGTGRIDMSASTAVNANRTFTFDITAPSTPGTYNFRWHMVMTGDWFGAYTTNVVVTVTADTVLPTISLATPASGATVSGTSVNVSANATDNVGVERVQFQVDNVALGTDDTVASGVSTYSRDWNTTTYSDGTHTVRARAKDVNGNFSAWVSRTVTVANDGTAPTVSITSPASGATLVGTVSVSANAADNVAVSQVEFFRGSTSLGVDTTSPYSVSWNTTSVSNATYLLTAVAKDTANNQTTSSAVSVTTNNPVPLDACTINSGESIHLNWSSSNATSCTVYADLNSNSVQDAGEPTVGTGTTGSGVSHGPLFSTTNYRINCTGTGGTSAPADSTTVTVLSSMNYTLSNSGNSSVIKTSGNTSTTNTITKTLTAGTSQAVTLSVSGLPSGVSVSGISSQGCSPTCQSVITFSVAPTTAVGTYPITVTGSPLGKTTTFNLVVSGNAMSVSCSANPTTPTLGQMVTWTADVTGGTPPFTYSWSGTNIPASPAPNTNPFNITYSTLGQKTAFITVTDTDSIQVACPEAVVQVNFSPIFEEF